MAWGHNTALILPKPILHELKLRAGDHVVLRVEDGGLYIRELEDDIWRTRIAQVRVRDREEQPVKS